MTKLLLPTHLFMISLVLTSACLKDPKSDLRKTVVSLTLSGRSQSSDGKAAANTSIFVEQSPKAEAISRPDGSFSIRFSTDRLEALSLEYGRQKQLHLYFVNDTGATESAVINELNPSAVGLKDLGVIQLVREEVVTGRVITIVGSALPTQKVQNARVVLGRKEALTNAEGLFTVSAPAGFNTPLIIEKKGYLQTQGEWSPGGAIHDFEVFDERLPTGSIEVLPALRDTSNRPKSLNYSATSTAYWIRFGDTPDRLAQNNNDPKAPWMELSEAKNSKILAAFAETFYYQFADQDRQILGPVLTYTQGP